MNEIERFKVAYDNAPAPVAGQIPPKELYPYACFSPTFMRLLREIAERIQQVEKERT